MRIFELIDTNSSLDKFINLLRNYQGRAASKKSPAKYNWAAIKQMADKVGFEMAGDYKTFKAIYDSTPALADIIKNFNAQGLELNVAGVADEVPDEQPQTSADAVAQTAASNVDQQIDKSQTGVKV